MKYFQNCSTIEEQYSGFAAVCQQWRSHRTTEKRIPPTGSNQPSNWQRKALLVAAGKARYTEQRRQS